MFETEGGEFVAVVTLQIQSVQVLDFELGTAGKYGGVSQVIQARCIGQSNGVGALITFKTAFANAGFQLAVILKAVGVTGG